MIIILPIEPIETRYTAQWYKNIPEQLVQRGCDVVQIDGEVLDENTSPGAFLNFCSTNVWKNSQINQLAAMFNEGKIKSGDKVLITDAWNTGILQIKYMKELLGIDVEIHAIWHAGSYDPNDFLGRMPNISWARDTERALAKSIDVNYFATRYHEQLFLDTLFSDDTKPKTVISGQPHELLIEILKNYDSSIKENQIIFPHRLAPEKQLDIFKDLEKSLPEYKFVTCQESRLTKDQYYSELAKSKICFSASLQETYGIGCAEASILKTIPLCPDRLSYAEIYQQYPEVLYPSEWTSNFEEYLKHKDDLIEVIRDIMNHYDKYRVVIEKFNTETLECYATADIMYERLS